MATNIKPNAVLKVRVNDKESWRRIPLHRLINEYKNNESGEMDTSDSNISVSFEKLCKYAILYSGLGSGKHVDDNELGNFEFQLTYTDEEGDQVQISTDEELVDAMLWKQESSDVLHVLASVKAKEKNDPTISPVDGQSYKSKPMLDLVDAIFSFVAGTVDIIRDEIKVAKHKSAEKEKSSEEPKGQDEERDELSFDPNFVHNRHTCDGCGVSPIVGHRYHATNIPDFDLCAGCRNKCALADISFIKAQDGVGDVPNRYEGFDPNFVHSRHTCDGCGSSPIIGYRWHSTNIPNYDLCHKCKSKTVATDVYFQLAQYTEPDRKFSFSQKKPCRKNRRWSRSSQNASSETEPSQGDLVLSMEISEELKRSIEKSLELLKNKTNNIAVQHGASGLSDHVENAKEEVYASEAKEEPTKLSESDLIQLNETLVSTGKPIEDEEIEKALFESSITTPVETTESDKSEKKEDKVVTKKLSSSEMDDIKESLISGEPVDEELEKAFYEASIASREEESASVIQSTMKKIVATEEVDAASDASAPSSTESIASEKSVDVKVITDTETFGESSKLSEVALSSISPSLAAEVISMDDLEYPMKDESSDASIESESFASKSTSTSSFQDVKQASYPRVDSDSKSDEEAIVEIPAPSSDVISLKSAESDLSMELDEESGNVNLKKSENSASFVSAAEKEDSDSDSATSASFSSEDSWNLVDENVHENIGSLLFQKGLN